MRTLIVHNPRSGFGSDSIYEFERALLRQGDECVFRILTLDPDEDQERLADAESFDLVVISGGDGTVSHALYMLRDRNIKTCIFPSGTANLLAANIGNASEPTAIAKACIEGRTFDADLAEMSWTDTEHNEHKEGFALMAGSGFDARLMHDAVPAKQALGEAAYFAAVLANLWPDVYHFTIEVDGVVHEHDGISCLIANTAMIQGDIDIAPGCVMDDGMLDLIVLETKDAAQLLLPIVAGIVDPTGRSSKRPHIATYRGAHIRVTSDKPMKVEVDGDVMEGETLSWEARSLPGCCSIVIDAMSRYASSLRAS
ncbi:MAG: NAD(+)/NADH kinase [Atopobiaceae bacterium]|nr:NAD(+)/NADH kinase [Atopobiaceae bacterium]MBR1828477.1 NAD(+)/NADH kinase [Atopobiaceae bacterium]